VVKSRRKKRSEKNGKVETKKVKNEIMKATKDTNKRALADP